MAGFKYIIAVDFEATCWEIQPMAPSARNSEIIEFPAVLFNLQTGQIEEVFHEYIKPTFKPILSDFCKRLTGITQDMVNNSLILESVLKKFHLWLTKVLKARDLELPKCSITNINGNCAFVAWTDHDFDTYLHLECQRKNIKKPEYFNQWIDARYIFRGFYGNNKLKFSAALECLGIHFEGKLHSGIDDAKNLAMLVYTLMKKGAKLKITKDLTIWKQLNEHFII